MCALPAIIRLIKTAPPVQALVLGFHCGIRDLHFLGRLDWSALNLLQGICPRMELRISGGSMNHFLSPESILDGLAGNETLMSLVRRDVVVLKPERVYKCKGQVL